MSPVGDDLAGYHPVFVLGSPRSGTTLVYSLLLASGEFPRYEEGETHLLECRAKYGSLQRESSWERFQRDWLASRQFRRSGLDAGEFVREAAEHRGSYLEMLGFFMAAMARREGVDRWAEKTPAHTPYLGELAAAFPTGKFIHVIRDGRDAATSMWKLGWTGTRSSRSLKQLVGAGKVWERYVQTGREAGRDLSAGRYLELNYEHVVEEPEDAIRTLEEFTGASLGGVEAAGSDVGALGDGFSPFDEGIDGISRRPVGRWRRRLTGRQAALLTESLRDTLDELGYASDRSNDGFGLRMQAKRLSLECSVELELKRWLREDTPIGRLSPTRLELDE